MRSRWLHSGGTSYVPDGSRRRQRQCTRAHMLAVHHSRAGSCITARRAAEYGAEQVDGLTLQAGSDVGKTAAVAPIWAWLTSSLIATSSMRCTRRSVPVEVVVSAAGGQVQSSQRMSCSEFLYWFKGVPLMRAAARRRSVTAARSCLPLRWRRPPTTRRAEPGSVGRTANRKPLSRVAAACRRSWNRIGRRPAPWRRR